MRQQPTRKRSGGTVQHHGHLANFFNRYGRLTLYLIPIGVAINFVGGQIASLLKLPLYLDTIGTILTGALCGGLPGALVGLLSNVINSITTPTLMPFAAISILIGLLAGLLSRFGVFRSLWKTLLSAIPFAFLGGGVGSLITIWLFGGFSAGGVAIITGALHAMGMNIDSAVFLASVPSDLVDKLVTVSIVFVLLRRVPNRLLVKVPYGHVYLGRKRRAVIEVADDTLAFDP